MFISIGSLEPILFVSFMEVPDLVALPRAGDVELPKIAVGLVSI